MPNKHTIFKPSKSIQSFDELERNEEGFCVLMRGSNFIRKSISTDSTDTFEVKLKGKMISLSNVYFNKSTETIYALLDYKDDKGGLDSQQKETIVDAEIQNANRALSLDQNASLKFVVYAGKERLLFSCKDKDVLGQLIDQIDPLSENPYWPAVLQSPEPA